MPSAITWPPCSTSSGLLFGVILRFFHTHRSLLLENLVLRQQLAVLKRKHPKPRFNLVDKLFWVAARRFWSSWKEALFLLMPETITRWHQAGFRLYWILLCRVGKRVGGGKRISHQVRDLIFQMVMENPTWGAPRIHGELLKLGFKLSERTVSRWGAASPERSRTSRALEGISPQSPRGHCCDGLFHGSNP